MDEDSDDIVIDVKEQHQKELLQQRHLHLYQLKALQGQLLENLISQVSDPDQPLDQGLKEEILKSVRETIDKSPNSKKRLSLLTTRTPAVQYDTCSDKNEDEPRDIYSPSIASTEFLNLPEPSVNEKTSIISSATYSPVHSPVLTGAGGKVKRSPLSPRSLNTSLVIERELATSKSNACQLIDENETLKTSNEELKRQIEQYQNMITVTEDKLKKTHLQLQRYEDSQTSQDKLNFTLQSRLTSTAAQLKEKEMVNDKLSEELTELKREYQCVNEEKMDLSERLNQSLTEIQYLHKENITLKDKIETLKDQLLDTQNELAQLQSIYDRHHYNEDQYRSIIDQLEMEIKSLRQKLQSQDNAWFELSSSQDHSYKQYDRRPSTTPTNLSSYPPSAMPTAVTSRSQPLTRKKWLETSEGGLLFGSPNVTSSNREVKASPVLAARHSLGKNFKMSTDNVLEAVRNKSVTSSPKYKREKNYKRKSIEERVEERLKKAREAEKRLVELQQDKERLESFLQRAPPSYKVTADFKQKKREAETKLDEVLKEIGSVRMIIRNSKTKQK